MASDSTPTGTAAGHGGNKIYVMGAANVGKSSFINRLLTSSYGGGKRLPVCGMSALSAVFSLIILIAADHTHDIILTFHTLCPTLGNKKRPDTPQATVSNLPGTTLDFLKIRLPNGVTVIDTPGLLNPGQVGIIFYDGGPHGVVSSDTV